MEYRASSGAGEVTDNLHSNDIPRVCAATSIRHQVRNWSARPAKSEKPRPVDGAFSFLIWFTRLELGEATGPAVP
jgi:hypothetical protein